MCINYLRRGWTGSCLTAGGIIPESILDNPAPTRLLYFLALSPPREHGWRLIAFVTFQIVFSTSQYTIATTRRPFPNVKQHQSPLFNPPHVKQPSIYCLHSKSTNSSRRTVSSNQRKQTTCLYSDETRSHCNTACEITIPTYNSPNK